MEIRKVGVVGLGTMGAGIAQVSVQSGFETVGREINEELGERGRATIERYLSRGVEKGRLGETELAATSISFTINMVAILPMLGIGQAVSVLVGQRLGQDPLGGRTLPGVGRERPPAEDSV